MSLGMKTLALFLLVQYHFFCEAYGQLTLTRTSPVGNVICSGDRVEYTCSANQIVSGISTLSWSIGGIDLPPFTRILGRNNMTVGETRIIPQLHGVIANITEVTSSGFTSTLVIDYAGDSVANQTEIKCRGGGNELVNLLNITSREVTSFVPLIDGFTLSGVQIETSTAAEMCRNKISYCIDIPEFSAIKYCETSRTVLLPVSPNLCQMNYTAFVSQMCSGSMRVSTLAVGNPNSLGSVTNIQCTSTSLFWSPPANSPDDCITGYEISWNGGSFIHSPSNEDKPSVSYDVLKENGFPVCQEANVIVTISPYVPALGVLRDKGNTSSVRSRAGEVTSVEPIIDGFALSGVYIHIGVSTELCNNTFSYCVNVPEVSTMKYCATSRTILLPVPLNLCLKNYTLIASQMCTCSSSKVSTQAVGNPNNVVGNVKNMKGTSTSSLFWSPPANRSIDCITGYEISWDGGSFIHSPSNEDEPHVSSDVLKENGFPVCEAVNVTISPYVPALGVLRDMGDTFTVTPRGLSNFRQLSGQELREIELKHDPQLLKFTARTSETVIIVLDSEWSGAFVQEGVYANIDCLPWLRNFPGGQVTWLQSNFLVDTSVTGKVIDVDMPYEIASSTRFVIGGEFKRWLNITATNIIQGREDADYGNYTCRVCVGEGDPLTRTDCHDATVTIYLPGAPPEINSTLSNEPDSIGRHGNLIYRIGANFCIHRNTDVSFTILCDILGMDPACERARPYPTPNRIWFKNDLVVYNVTDGEDPFNGVNGDFFYENPFFVPGVLDPRNLLFHRDGEITYLTQVDNSTNVGVPESVARRMLFDSILGEWTCSVSNVYGSDTATSVVRECGMEPVIPKCPTSSSIIYPEGNDVVPVACDTVCIREGTSIILDCTVTSGTPPIIYTWTDGDGNFLSNEPTLKVSVPDSYSCNAENLDNPENWEATLLSISPQVSFNGFILGFMNKSVRGDNGCGRLSRTINADACIFVGETLSLYCRTVNRIELDIVDVNMLSRGATHSVLSTVDNVNDVNGTFGCLLSQSRVHPYLKGPCGPHALEFNVQVFDSARINRMDDVGQRAGDLGAGRFNEVQFVDENSTITLFCPSTGIPDPMESWLRLVVDDVGTSMEVVITGEEDAFTINVRQHSETGASVSELTIQSYSDALRGAYVCRTSNIAGQDTATVNITTRYVVNMWSIGAWTECNKRCAQGTRQRSVVCRQMKQVGELDEGRIVPDAFCNETMPISNETCEELFPNDCLVDPVWIAGPFGPCSNNCSGGFRFRKVVCQIQLTGEIRQNSDCSGSTMPPPYEVCPVTCCNGDEDPAYCAETGAQYCHLPAVQQVCCQTCEQ